MPGKLIYWISDGAGANMGHVPGLMVRWIRRHGTPSLIVYGGDIYERGKPSGYEQFRQQMDGDLSLMCALPGNQDWQTRHGVCGAGCIPVGYENFWSKYPPPHSAQPINTERRGGARYEHFADLEGWRLIFLDTGNCDYQSWPMGDSTRQTWLQGTLLSVPGRAKLVFSHHSRLSRGLHGDNPGMDRLWKTLFTPEGEPLAACTFAGHDHNVSVYSPRSRDEPAKGPVPFEKGIHLVVNGAGGAGHYMGAFGTVPDLAHDPDHFCITRIHLKDSCHAVVDVLSFGSQPTDSTCPVTVPGSELRLAV